LIDYPGKICSIIFTIGCNFRCPFCHNRELVILEKIKEIPEDFFLSYLEDKKKLLDAIEITGGEPTIHKDLPIFIQKIKEMGYLVKLDTNGTNPQMVQFLLDKKLINYVAMDIKAPLDFEKYNKMVGGVLTEKMFDNIKKTMKILLNSDIDYEFRTTIIKNLHSKDDIIEICKKIKNAKQYSLQKFNPENALSIEFHNFQPFDNKEIEEIILKGKKFIKNIIYKND
jgi:pyruvate formate lyase activating enzyme